MTTQEQQQLAKKLNGLLGTGTLNWLGNYNMELKKHQFSIFFNKESQAKKALSQVSDLNASLIKVPKFVNCYFKYAIRVII